MTDERDDERAPSSAAVTTPEDDAATRAAIAKHAADARWRRTARFVPPGGRQRVVVELEPGETPYAAAARWLRANEGRAA